ncbi:hypothetical protein ACIRPU_14040 [Streptomyces sp. NPDC102259]|uniref:hypothetical protein n=1 Tax=Streptomyces sp. NPDC102259 TaxID=3366148 RepID=UPI0037F2B0D4
MEKQKAPIDCTPFRTGTVTQGIGAGAMAHLATWRFAYSIPGVRDWIMRRSK